MHLRIVLTIVFSALLMSVSARAQETQSKELNLESLGFEAQDTQSNPDMQRLLEDRRFYLRQHQIWGLVATGTMALAVLSGGEGDLPPEHPYIAGLAFTSYAAAAYTAWMAPEYPGAKSYTGGTAWHRRLAWIHVPGMILTPVLGYMAAKKIDRNEKLDGIEKYHKDVAGVTAVALGLAMISVSFEF